MPFIKVKMSCPLTLEQETVLKQDLSFIPDSNGPLLYNPKNSSRFCSVSAFKRHIKNDIIEIGQGYSSVSPYLANNKDRFEYLIRNTVKNNLSLCGLEADEYAFLYGIKPNSTSGIHYCDFGAQGELRRLSLLQDRWLSKYQNRIDILSTPGFQPPASPIKEYTFLNPGDSFRLTADSGMQLAAEIKLELDSFIQTDNPQTDIQLQVFLLQLRSSRGLSARIEMEYTQDE